MSTETKPAPTRAEYDAFFSSQSTVEAVLLLLAAQTHSEMERERVDAYIRPIFDRYDFREEDGTKITGMGSQWLSNDPKKDALYDAECAAAHRAHGFTGPDGHCPALVAKVKLMEAENAVIKIMAEMLRFDPANGRCHGENRKKLLELAIGACVTMQPKLFGKFAAIFRAKARALR
jgi:hypothetical protein